MKSLKIKNIYNEEFNKLPPNINFIQIKKKVDDSAYCKSSA